MSTYTDRYTEQAAAAALPLVGPQGEAPQDPAIVRGSRPDDHCALVEFVVVDPTVRTDDRGDTYVLAAPIAVIEPGVSMRGDLPFYPTLGLVDVLRTGDMI